MKIFNMISFTPAQLTFLEYLFNHFKIKDGMTEFDKFNRTYKKPIKKRAELEHTERCIAYKKDCIRCNGRRISPGYLCGIHLKRGVLYGTVCAQDPVNYTFNSTDVFVEETNFSQAQNTTESLDDLMKAFFELE